MKLTFKNVGQGDSIILEWTDNGQPQIGLIDCNRIDGKNPVAEYIAAGAYQEIDFLILSHPHSDHYSGMIELLDVIEDKQIILKRFGHSVHILGADFYKYLKWMEIGTAELKDLQQLITRVDELYKSGIILKMEMITENWGLNLANDINIKCLSPSQVEAAKYMEVVSFEPEKNKKAASSGANYLSTMFKLTVGKTFYLLTADSETLTLERILREQSHKDLLEDTMSVGQLPHHGAEKNHFPRFWKQLKKTDKPVAIASAGVNLKYNHPRFPVLKSFHDEGYDIHCTNIVNGMEKYLELLVQLGRKSALLDTFSELSTQDMGGDKIF